MCRRGQLDGVGVGAVMPLAAHCRVPCGADDHARVHAMAEDAVTVAKAAKLITELSGKTDAQSQQQMMRWVMNKESHAQKIMETVADYFLAQRVRPTMENYPELLLKRHGVVATMKVSSRLIQPSPRN